MDYERINVIGIIEKDDLVVIGKKASNGMWHIPSESVERGERHIDALIRGMLEETNLHVAVKKLFHEQGESGTLTKWYLCGIVSGELKAGSDLSEVKYIPRTQVFSQIYKDYKAMLPHKVKRYLEREPQRTI